MGLSSRSSRRDFLKSAVTITAGAGLATTAGARPPRQQPDAEFRVAIMGAGGRGTSLAASFARLARSEVVYVCDADRRRAEEARRRVTEVQGATPAGVVDFRRILDDPSVDALVIAAPNHWHAPATILACQAGKHVYVEKPGSHNGREAELIVEAASKYGRVVQMGNQRRSWPKIVEGIDRVRSGDVGTVHYSRAWYANTRGSIGTGNETAVPDWLDYELWQGPAPHRPYRDNLLHYNWHWFWNWGSAESGNNGIHALDLCRWGLGVDYPSHVTSTGGRFFWQDDQETPDTQLITLTFEDGKSILWEGLSCNRHGIHGQGFGASFHGDGGSLVVDGLGYRLYDERGELVEDVRGEQGFDIDEGHLSNFRNAVLDGERLRAPIADGQKSALLCHLGNVAYRTRRALHCDPKTGRVLHDADAAELWARTYAPGWEPVV